MKLSISKTMLRVLSIMMVFGIIYTQASGNMDQRVQLVDMSELRNNVNKLKDEVLKIQNLEDTDDVKIEKAIKLQEYVTQYSNALLEFKKKNLTQSGKVHSRMGRSLDKLIKLLNDLSVQLEDIIKSATKLEEESKKLENFDGYIEALNKSVINSNNGGVASKAELTANGIPAERKAETATETLANGALKTVEGADTPVTGVTPDTATGDSAAAIQTAVDTVVTTIGKAADKPTAGSMAAGSTPVGKPGSGAATEEPTAGSMAAGSTPVGKPGSGAAGVLQSQTSRNTPGPVAPNSSTKR